MRVRAVIHGGMHFNTFITRLLAGNLSVIQHVSREGGFAQNVFLRFPSPAFLRGGGGADRAEEGGR